MKPKILSIFLLPLLSILFAGESFSCSCNRVPNPPCSVYHQTPLIFDGEVLDVKNINETGEQRDKYGYFKRLVKFKVKNGYKGTVKSEVEILTGDGGSDCGYTFEIGKRYLVYAYGEGKLFGTSHCTRTRPIEYAKEDLIFFSQLASLPKGAMIFGSVKKFASGYPGGDAEDWGATKPLANIPVKIRGQKSTLLRTDQNGKFRVSGFPPGIYTLEPLLPKNLKFSIFTMTKTYDYLEIPDKGCGEAKFYVEFEGEINGRVLDKNGKGVKGVQVDLISADYKFGWREDGIIVRLDFGFTDYDGNYRITGIPPGIYHLSIGVAGAPEYNEYQPTFYPNVLDRSKATVIKIADGTKLRNFNFRLPEKKVKKSA